MGGDLDVNAGRTLSKSIILCYAKGVNGFITFCALSEAKGMDIKMKIITITLNPAFDLHYEMKNFRLYKENYVDSILVAAGGKGINISRALSKNNIDNTAYVILGKENAADFVSRLEADDITFKGFYCEGRIRENITIHTPNMPETRISLDSFSLNDEILIQLLKELKLLIYEHTIVTFTGRIPNGLSIDCVINFLRELRELNCLLVIDCNSFSIEDLINIRPWLIKPNEQEVQMLLGKQITTIEQARKAAIEIYEMGIKNVIVSMGKEGAAAATNVTTTKTVVEALDKTSVKLSDTANLSYISYIVEVPRIKAISTIGAGDSLIAGFIVAYVQGFSYEECLRNAAAFSTAACLTKGTEPPRPDDIERLKQEVRIKNIV